MASTNSGGWEGVKGFFRRQTQMISERYRDAPKTTDAVVDQNTATVFEFQKRIKSLEAHMNGFVQGLALALSSLDGVKEDLAVLGSAQVEGLDIAAKNVEMAVKDMRSKLDAVNEAFAVDHQGRGQYEKDCAKLRAQLEDRKAKMLEYDFFQNKLAGLRAKPPSDATRIPRNEARLDEWGKAYDESNERAKALAQQLIAAGARLSINTATTVTQEAGKFFDNAGRTCRAAFLGQGLPQAAAMAMAAAQAQVSQAITPEARQAAQQAAMALAKEKAQTQPPSTQNDSFNGNSRSGPPTSPGTGESQRVFSGRDLGSTRSSQAFSDRPSQRFVATNDDPFKVA